MSSADVRDFTEYIDQIFWSHIGIVVMLVFALVFLRGVVIALEGILNHMKACFAALQVIGQDISRIGREMNGETQRPRGPVKFEVIQPDPPKKKSGSS